jgi:transcriptional repressor NF-X1
MASVTLSCPCGRIQQQAPCGHCASSPSGRAGGTAVPKCTTECAVARRNARLAEALGITPTTTPGGAAAAAAYTDELQGAGRADRRFLTLVEKTFDDFVRGSRRTQVLPHMPPERRKFVIQVGF